MKRPNYYGIYLYVGDIEIYGYCTYGYSKYDALNIFLQNEQYKEDIIVAINKATRMEVEQL